MAFFDFFKSQTQDPEQESQKNAQELQKEVGQGTQATPINGQNYSTPSSKTQRVDTAQSQIQDINRGEAIQDYDLSNFLINQTPTEQPIPNEIDYEAARARDLDELEAQTSKKALINRNANMLTKSGRLKTGIKYFDDKENISVADQIFARHFLGIDLTRHAPNDYQSIDMNAKVDMTQTKTTLNRVYDNLASANRIINTIGETLKAVDGKWGKNDYMEALKTAAGNMTGTMPSEVGSKYQMSMAKLAQLIANSIKGGSYQHIKDFLAKTGVMNGPQKDYILLLATIQDQKAIYKEALQNYVNMGRVPSREMLYDLTYLQSLEGVLKDEKLSEQLGRSKIDWNDKNAIIDIYNKHKLSQQSPMKRN